MAVFALSRLGAVFRTRGVVIRNVKNKFVLLFSAFLYSCMRFVAAFALSRLRSVVQTRCVVVVDVIDKFVFVLLRKQVAAA